jgi:hypothetical protein
MKGLMMNDMTQIRTIMNRNRKEEDSIGKQLRTYLIEVFIRGGPGLLCAVGQVRGRLGQPLHQRGLQVDGKHVEKRW